MAAKEGLYALYEDQGETFVMTGTIDQIAERLGVRRQTVWYYQTPSAVRRNSRRRLYRVG